MAFKRHVHPCEYPPDEASCAEQTVPSESSGSDLIVDLTPHIKNGMTILSLEDVANRRRKKPQEIWPDEEEPNSGISGKLSTYDRIKVSNKEKAKQPDTSGNHRKQ